MWSGVEWYPSSVSAYGLVDMKEVFKDVVGWEGIYQVSNTGRVKSLDREVLHRGHKRFVEGRILIPTTDKDGYQQVHLAKNGNRYLGRVHRLVAKAFIDNPKNLPIINHKDRNTSNNLVDNLEWCTYKYNSNYKDTQQRKARAREKKVYQYTKKGELVAVHPSPKKAALTGDFKAGGIVEVCGGRYLHHRGYRWSYTEL